MIKAEHLTKKYRKKTAVDDVSFSVETGKVTGFLGPNGAGKSTTMRLMLGLDNGKGRTTFDNKPLIEHANPASLVGILLEAKAFHPTRTAKNHLKMLAAAGGVSDARVDEVLDQVGLTAVARKKPGKFSLGMSQRLGIAAAILGNPRYLILDEPANGLDPEGIHWLRQFLRDYADKGNAVFVSSHLLSEMSLMADDLVVIGKGKLIASGSVKSFIDSAQGSSIFVRVAKASIFERILKQKKIKYTMSDLGFELSGTSTDLIGKLAFQSGIPILELANKAVSLEDAFLGATASSQEYKSHPEAKPRAKE